MNMNIGDAQGGRGRRGSLPPPAAAAIVVSGIATVTPAASAAATVATVAVDPVHQPPHTLIGHGIVGKDIPIMARLAKARCWSKQ